MTRDATTTHTTTEIVPTPDVIDTNLVSLLREITTVSLLREITTTVTDRRMSGDAVAAEVEVAVATHRVTDNATEAEAEVVVVNDPFLLPLAQM